MFKMSAIVVKELVKLQRNFLWNWGSEGRKIAWVSWNKMCQPREEGGLRMLDMRRFNTSHLFCTCRVAWLVWAKCYEWMRLATMDHQEPKKHFASFKVSGAKDSVNLMWVCVWIAVVGKIWKHRNIRIFIGGRIDHNEIFDLAQLKAWSWIKFKTQGVCFPDWCLEPMVCMKFVKNL